VPCTPTSLLPSFAPQVKPLGDSIVSATVDIYRALSEQLLPTPSKSHYLFNTRDLAKIVQGLSQVSGAGLEVAGRRPLLPRARCSACPRPIRPCLLSPLRHLPLPDQASKSLYDSREELLALWCHETCRVVADRMWDPADVAWVKKQLGDKLAASLGSSWEALFEAHGGDVGGRSLCVERLHPPPLAGLGEHLL
jgi:dynein heavy chain